MQSPFFVFSTNSRALVKICPPSIKVVTFVLPTSAETLFSGSTLANLLNNNLFTNSLTDLELSVAALRSLAATSAYMKTGVSSPFCLFCAGTRTGISFLLSLSEAAKAIGLEIFLFNTLFKLVVIKFIFTATFLTSYLK